MPTTVTLVARSLSSIVLIAQEQHEFLDSNAQFIGRRRPARKGQTQAMVNAIQNLPYDLTVLLANPDGSKFSLAGATTIRLSVFATTPLEQVLGVVAGTATGAPIDGVVAFPIPGIDFEGFGEGEVEVVKAGRTYGFERLACKFDRRRST